jgi:hypothetical protein
VTDADVAVVDGNFAKLAAKGISIIISSGDAGSGYVAPEQCGGEGTAAVGISGEVIATSVAHSYSECCYLATVGASPAGWTFAQWPQPDGRPSVAAATRLVRVAGAATAGISFKNAVFHVEHMPSADPKLPWKAGDLYALHGEVGAKTGGTVTATALSGAHVGDHRLLCSRYRPIWVGLCPRSDQLWRRNGSARVL